MQFSAPLLAIYVDVLDVISLGPTPLGESRVIPFSRGHFEGPDLAGELLPGGTDWQRVREDGALEIEAHYVLETVQGERIEVSSIGLRVAPREVLARLSAGEVVAPDQYYFRTSIRLRTSAPRLLHLNDRLFIGVGERAALRVKITVYQVP